MISKKYVLRAFVIALLAILLSTPISAYAAAYEASWFTSSVNQCGGYVDLTFTMYYNASGTTNDDKWEEDAHLRMKVGNGSYFNIAELKRGGGTWNWNPNNDGVVGVDRVYEYTSGNWPNVIASEVRKLDHISENDNSTVGDGRFEITMRVFFKGTDVGKTISFDIDGVWEDGGSAGVQTVNFDNTETLNTITASDATNCSGTEITWTVPAGLCSGTNVEIFRGTSSNLIATVPATTGVYFDNSGVPGQVYPYWARFSKDFTYSFARIAINGISLTPLSNGITSFSNAGTTSSQEDGARKNVPDAPSNLDASTTLCDTEIDISWDWTTTSPDSFRIVKGGVNVSPTLGGSLRSYTDTDINRGEVYTYEVQAKNNCGWSSYSNSKDGISPLGPSTPANFEAYIVPGVGIQLTWGETPNATSYQIERSLLGGGGSTFFDPDGAADDTSYLDESLVQCRTYEYRLRAFNDCSSTGVIADTIITTKLIPDLSNTFDLASNPFQASKGYYSDRVELSWSVANNENFVNQFKIYRKIAGSADDSIVIETVNSGSNIHNDFLALAGVLYKYTIVAESQCEQATLKSNPASVIGFRSPIGTISGQVSFAGGIAVEGVKLSANSSSGTTGYALNLDGTASLAIPYAANLNSVNGFTTEIWIKPTSQTGYFDIVNRPGVFMLKHDNSNYEFEVFPISGPSVKVSLSDALVNLNNFNQLTASLHEDTIRIFLNGNLASQAFFPSANLAENTNGINIGDGFEGVLDEFRYWIKGKSPAAVNQDFSRLMNGGESNLVVYLKMNENSGSFAYDFSRTSVTNFNKNHASFIGSPSWTSDIPSASQLAIASYTNAQGNYVLSVPYSGSGETFVLTPSYLTHVFDPSTRAIFVGEGSTVFNNIDFDDISSFTVQGRLIYANTSCVVPDATLTMDGNPVVANGTVVKTDAQGNFLIQVPIGQHYIAIEKTGHYMNVGRFPETGTYDFQDDKAGVNFQDSTLVKVVGRVVGGLKQASFIPGLGKSKNNIGTAAITLTSQQGNGCFTTTQLTDTAGEYTIYAPPLRYIPTVLIPLNPTVNFGVLNLVDLVDATDVTTLYDTIGIGNIDSIQFNVRLDYIRQENPNLVVKDLDLIHDFMGDTSYTYIHINGDTIYRNLRQQPLPWPVFNNIASDDSYSCMITAFETYVNLDDPLNPIFDTVPATAGSLVFNNELADYSFGTVDLSDINTLDSLKYLQYTFELAFPNFSENASIPQYSFTRKFQLNLNLPNGTSIPWLPNVFRGTGSPSFNAVYDHIYRGYILGTKADGQQFVSAGPQVPEYVLRDPPGSGSSASREVGSTKTTEKQWSYDMGYSSETVSHLYVGSKINTGSPVMTVETDVLTDTNFGSQSTTTGGRSGSQKVTITNLQTWSTDSSPNNPGRNSDVYLGTSVNITYGISETLRLVPDTMCSSVECLVQPTTTDSFSMARNYGVAILPGGYNTNFIYTEDHIKNQLIPDLIELRNALLDNPTRYTVGSMFPLGHPYYGLNNDDPRVNGDSAIINPEDILEYKLQLFDEPYSQIVTVGFDLNTTEQHWRSSQAQKDKWALFSKYDDSDTLSITGNSYTYNALTLEDSLTGDSVRWINNQIKHWEEAIMLNEWEKVNINNASLRNKLKEIELTKIYNEYEGYIIAYTTLNAATLAATIGFTIAAIIPNPSTKIIFAVRTAAGVAKFEVYDNSLEYLAKRQVIINQYSQTQNNFSISSGVTYTSSTSHNTAKSVQTNVFSSSSAGFGVNLKNKVNNFGTGLNKGKKFSFETKTSGISASSNSETVKFTLLDPDQGDFFSVDVYPSLLGWGPVFKLRPGGKTSCPYEDRVLTEYYLQTSAVNPNPYAPSYLLSERTQQRDRPLIDVAPFLLTNVPITSPAVFNLTVTNDSESDDTRTYKLGLVSTSNPFGAIVRIDGANVFADVTLGPDVAVNKVLSIEKGPGPTYNYDSLLIIVYSECDPDIRDSVYLSAHFLPTCTDVNFATPNNQWVLNNSFIYDSLPVAIIDYNINFFDFDFIRLDYKPSSSSVWVGLQTFFKDTSGLNNPTALQIPTNVPFTSWNWETDQITDGAYDLRLVSQCTLEKKISVTHTGLMDRINPHPFGTPSPADGILDPNDDISIRFNEPIDLGSLTSLNFDVRGVINGSETTHASNLYFDGINDYVEVTGGAPLQQRDFTIEFSVKRGTLGSEAIITQGPDGNEQIYIGFDNGNHLQCKINGVSVNSLNTYVDNDWHYFAVSYSYANETVEIFEASGTTTAAIVNSGSTSMFEKYEGADKMLIGKDAASGSHFTGNIDDVRVWNTARSLTEFSLTKSIQLSANEPGLLYNWRFDEAEGIFAKDHVRSRDGIIFGAEWTVEPSGSALVLDGIDDYLRITKGDVNITQGMDYTLEFWFNSTQANASSMISTGKGDGIGADSLYAWNIAKDAAGMIHVYHNGEDFVSTNANYFDGEWHHFALILNRQGNLTSYLDGNLEKSVQATPYKDLGGPAFYLGARGYYVGSVETTDNYFEGSIDEFRFWDASRKFEQVARDKNNRMKGDEYALRMYLPFEDYQLDPTGIAILTPSTAEQIDPLNHPVTNPNGALLTATTPKIKIQRPIESIAFTYSVNNDQIIITPTTNQALIENVTLDVTVKNVKDLHGNVMESPKTWIAYMDKNQVIWQDDLLAFDKAFGAPLSFTSGISNEGGAAKNFTIQNIPDWLTVTPASGIIQPNSQRVISFVVDPNVNIGDYSQDIHLLTDFGFPEKLTIDLKVREEEPNWTVNPADFDFSMSIIGYLKIKNVVSTSEEDILAVFVDDECRGLVHLQYLPQLDRYLAFLDVYSNVTDGEDLKFKIWDASSGTMYTEVDPLIIPFVENDVIGTINNPQLFETNYEISYEIPLNAGWNWVSNFLFNSDSTDLDKTMESLEAVTGDEIKTLTHGFSNYLNEVGTPIGWTGDINTQGIRPELGYKLKVSQNDTLVLKGDILDPTSRTIRLTKGWNWIGFISIRNQSITQALGNHNPTDGDLIKAKSQFAVYNTQMGWVGSLQAMKPGQGYMYFSADTIDFVYPFAGMFKSSKEVQENLYTNDTWSVDDSPFAANMTSIIKVNSDCDYLINNQQLTLGVFDNTGIARGISPIEMNAFTGRTFATVAGDGNEKMTFNILDNATKKVYGLEEILTYVPNTHLGSLESPWEVHVSEETCFKMKADAGVLSAYFKVYPTVIESTLNMDYIGRAQDSDSKARLYNVWGQKVWESAVKVEQGFNRIKLDLSRLDLAPGVYHFILDANGSTESVKLISK
jgi:hypothetical protein